MSFIKKHLLEKIKKYVNGKQDSVNFSGFFYFDNPIIDIKTGNRKIIINRVNRDSIYEKEEIIPLIKNQLNGSTLVDIFFRVKNDEFFFYKKVNGKDHRVRFKNGTKK